MKDEASAALERLHAMASLGRIDAETMIAPMDARAILAHIAALEARAEKAEADCGHWARDYEERGKLLVAESELRKAAEQRANEAEAKVAAAEERGLIFNMLPDGRLDFCAIREGSRLWEYRVRADALAAQVALLREAVTWLLNCHRGLDRHDHGVGGDGYWGNIDVATAFARQALAAAPAAPALPRLNIRCETTDGHVTGSTYLNVVRVEAEDDGSFTAVTDHWPAAYAALAQQTEGKAE